MAHTTATITRISPTTAQIIAVSNCGFGENSEIIRSGDMYPKTSAITPIITPNSPNTTVGALVLCFWMFLAFWTSLAFWTFLALPPGWHGLPAV